MSAIFGFLKHSLSAIFGILTHFTLFWNAIFEPLNFITLTSFYAIIDNSLLTKLALIGIAY
jgi:hypothetical protein